MRTVMRPPGGVYFSAFEHRFVMAWRNSLGSAVIVPIPSGVSTDTW
jgi:hypothetical protein